MTSSTIINAAKSLDSRPEFKVVLEHLMQSYAEVVFSLEPEDHPRIREALIQYHTMRALADVVTQLAQERPTDGK